MDNFRKAQRPQFRGVVDGFASRPVVRQVSQSSPVVNPSVDPAIDMPKPMLSDIMPASSPTLVPSTLVTPIAPSKPIRPKVMRTIKPAALAPQVTATPAPKASPIALPNLDLNLDYAPAKSPNRLAAGYRFRKWLLRGGIVSVVLLMAVGGLLSAQAYSKVHKVFRGTANRAVALQSDVNPLLLKGEGDGRVNVLLLGIGGSGHDGPDLTDTIMVASIDPVNGTTTLLSVPRDLWVVMPNSFMGANQKINAAYEVGKYKYLGKIDGSNANVHAIQAGFATADQTISNVLGIPIHYNLLVNFQAFRQAIDTVGGVTVNVPDQLYDPTMAWENNRNPVLAAKGVQQMDGVKALMYVRSRETSSDFARSERQRLVLMALKDKMLSAGTIGNPLKISQLMSAFGNNMMTDFSLSDAARIYDLTKGITNDKITSLDLVTAPNTLVGTGNMNGISIDQPKAGLNNYAEIQKFVHTKLRDGYLIKENAQVAVFNGTTRAGLATTKGAELTAFGYNIVKVDNAPPAKYPKTVVVDLTNGVDKYTKHYLENRYGVTAVSQLPDATLQPAGAHFVVILGDDQL